MVERKAFEEWQVHQVYMDQEGRCKNCGGSLDYGMGTGEKFEKHHEDGDHSNVKTENLSLLCKPCHMATLAKKDPEYKKNYEAYMEKKAEIFADIITLLEKAINKELAGTVINSSIEIINMAEKKCMEHFDMNRGLFYPPPSVKAMISYRNMVNEVEAMKEGIKIGLAAFSNLNREDKKE